MNIKKTINVKFDESKTDAVKKVVQQLEKALNKKGGFYVSSGNIKIIGEV